MMLSYLHRTVTGVVAAILFVEPMGIAAVGRPNAVRGPAVFFAAEALAPSSLANHVIRSSDGEDYAELLKRFPSSPFPRIQSHEFNDKPWFNETMRHMITDCIELTQRDSNIPTLMADVLMSVVKQSKIEHIIELAAGSGGSSIDLIRELQKREQPVDILLTDLNPDAAGFVAAFGGAQEHIRYRPEPLDATAIPPNLEYLIRLIMNGFHHFDKRVAAGFLKDAYDSRAPVVIFEIADRRVIRMLCVSLLCIYTMFQYILPIVRRRSRSAALLAVPAAFAYAWDGLISCWRAYTPGELWAMVQNFHDTFEWEMGIYKTSPYPFIRLTYLTGVPKPLKSAA